MKKGNHAADPRGGTRTGTTRRGGSGQGADSRGSGGSEAAERRNNGMKADSRGSSGSEAAERRDSGQEADSRSGNGAGAGRSGGCGTLYLCATPIGNLEDITLRVLNTLREVDLIAAEDTRNTMKLLNHYDIHTPLTSYHEHNKYDKAEELIGRLRAGRNIAVVTDAGTPAISDPGEVLAARCIEQGIRVTSLPGACALITGLTMSGMPARRFVFEGFLPSDKKERAHVLDSLRGEERTIILYEAPHHLLATLRELDEVLTDGAPMPAPAAQMAYAAPEEAECMRTPDANESDTTGDGAVCNGSGRVNRTNESEESLDGHKEESSCDVCTGSRSAQPGPSGGRGEGDSGGRSPSGARRIVLCRELTKCYEEAISMTLPEAVRYYEENTPRGEYVLILEGADPEAKRRREQAAWETMTLEEHMGRYESQGISHKDAMKLVARDRGLPKREVYRALLNLPDP